MPTVQLLASPGRGSELAADLQEAGEVFVIGTADCGQLGLGEDVTEVLRARLSSIASGQKVRMPSSIQIRAHVIAEMTSVSICQCHVAALARGPVHIAMLELVRSTARAWFTAS